MALSHPAVDEPRNGGVTRYRILVCVGGRRVGKAEKLDLYRCSGKRVSLA